MIFQEISIFFDNNLDEMKNLDSKVYMYNQKFNFHFLWRHYHPISVRILFPFISIFDYAFSFEREKIQKILWKLRKFNQFPKRGGIWLGLLLENDRNSRRVFFFTLARK